MVSSEHNVEMPTVEATATVDEILSAILVRLGSIAQVIEAEHKWLAPKVEAFRKLDDDGIAYDLEQGWIDQSEADEKKAEDNLILKRANVDRHLENLKNAAIYIADASTTLRAVVSGAYEVPA